MKAKFYLEMDLILMVKFIFFTLILRISKTFQYR